MAPHGAIAMLHRLNALISGARPEDVLDDDDEELAIPNQDDKGSVEKWRAEVNTPNILARGGWNKNSLKSGDQITVVGYRAKNGSNMLRVQKVVLSNGQELDAHWGGVY